MRQMDKQKVYVRKRIVKTGDDGGTNCKYDTAKALNAVIQPVSGRVEAEIYGEKITKMLKLVTDERVIASLKDGVCIYVPKDSEPDYSIVFIERWPKSVNILVEKVL